MDLSRSIVPVSASLAAAAVTGLLAVGVQRFRRKRTHVLRSTTGGCTPDVGVYMDGRILIHEVDGSHQGIAVAMLRDRFLDEETESEPFVLDEVEPVGGQTDDEVLTLEYDDTLRSCVEAAINMALNLAEYEIDDQCSCGDEECDAGAVDYETLHLVAGRKMTEFAITFESAAAAHASQCRICAAEGTRAPGYLRAQFCRDLADDLLLNFDSDTVNMRGVPVQASGDVLAAMVEFVAEAHDVSAEFQIDRLTQGVAQSIAHKEGHTAPQA